MTRYTNLGRKRTYVEAGFDHRDEDATPTQTPGASTSTAPESHVEAEPPSYPLPDYVDTSAAAGVPSEKRKRKRSKKRKDGGTAQNEETPADGEVGQCGSGEEKVVKESLKSEKVKKANLKLKDKKKAKRVKDAADRAAASEKRRLKRIAERHANTICFVCRENGHAAVMCPNKAKNDSEEAATGAKKGQDIVGICYRCGSKKHTLSRCRKTENPAKPMPFASCFVCSGKGHLASSCPENKIKGVYPNGGCCKLCGQTDHLAKNCGLRKPETTAVGVLLGVGHDAGADEDDFHSFRRKNAEVDRDVMTEEKVRKMAKVKAGVHTGIVKAYGTIPSAKPKKVVNF